MSTSRQRLANFAGWICVILAVFLVAFAAFMLVDGSRPLDCLKTASTSLIPATIAVACLLPSKRTIALRVLGGVVCAACIGTLVFFLVSPPAEDVRVRFGTLIVIAIAGGVMAVKGKWPGSDHAESSNNNQ